VFDYIHAGTPILCTDLVEVTNIVKKHHVGVVLDELSPASIAEKIQYLQTNPDVLNSMKENCKTAAAIENWEYESRILEEIYPKVGKN
jgi:glycosyltransferase involved in cell wall biosynthesis